MKVGTDISLVVVILHSVSYVQCCLLIVFAAQSLWHCLCIEMDVLLCTLQFSRVETFTDLGF